MPELSDFDAFVAAASPRLLRTTYLLTRDRASAEDLRRARRRAPPTGSRRAEGPYEQAARC